MFKITDGKGKFIDIVDKTQLIIDYPVNSSLLSYLSEEIIIYEKEDTNKVKYKIERV